MRRMPLLLLVAFLAVGPWSCGGNVSTAPAEAADAAAAEASVDASKPDASTPDAAIVDASTSDAGPADAMADVAPTDAGAEFCAPPDKASLDGIVVGQPPVTTSMLVMDCCEGFVARFHTEPSLGTDLSLMVRSFGMMSSGDYVVPTDGGGLEVTVSAGDVSWSATAASGSLHVDAPSWDQPTVVSFCLEADAPGELVDGARLFASDVVVAPWSWQNRFEVRLLADPAITAQQASQVPLESLEIAAGEPLLHLMSVAWYEASTHTVQWDGWYTSEYLLNQLPPVGVAGLPFVVLADGKPVYLGAFMTMTSSFTLSMPVIVVEDMQERSFRIDDGYPSGASGVDLRDDPRVRKVLEESQKLAP